MTIIRAATVADLNGINDIYNYFVEHSNAIFDLTPRSIEDAEDWFSSHKRSDRPVLVSVEGEVLEGWVSLSTVSSKQGYDSTVEISVYVSPHMHRRGLGSRLVSEVLLIAESEKVHCVIARISQDNQASTALFEQFGFSKLTVVKEVAWKFGEFQDLLLMQKLLPDSAGFDSD